MPKTSARRAEEIAFRFNLPIPPLEILSLRRRQGETRFPPLTNLTRLALELYERARDDEAIMNWLTRRCGDWPGWRAAGLGVAHVVTDEDHKTFQIYATDRDNRTGDAMILVPFLVGGLIGEIECLDILGFRPATPAKLYHLRDPGCEVLHYHNDWASVPRIALARDILSWLRSWTEFGPLVEDAPCVLIVEPASIDTQTLLTSDSEIICDDDEHALEIRKLIAALRRHLAPPLPKLLVRES